MNNKTIYIHYGHDNYVTPSPIKNLDWFTKPSGGLWASRKDGKCTWKDWCTAEEFHLDQFDSWFEFTLKDDARILELSNVAKLDDLPKWRKREYEWVATTYYLDFEEISKHYDAIEITDISKLYWALYGWDCNCILILNPDIIELI